MKPAALDTAEREDLNVFGSGSPSINSMASPGSRERTPGAGETSGDGGVLGKELRKTGWEGETGGWRGVVRELSQPDWLAGGTVWDSQRSRRKEEPHPGAQAHSGLGARKG